MIYTPIIGLKTVVPLLRPQGCLMLRGGGGGSADYLQILQRDKVTVRRGQRSTDGLVAQTERDKS